MCVVRLVTSTGVSERKLRSITSFGFGNTLALLFASHCCLYANPHLTLRANLIMAKGSWLPCRTQ